MNLICRALVTLLLSAVALVLIPSPHVLAKCPGGPTSSDTATDQDKGVFEGEASKGGGKCTSTTSDPVEEGVWKTELVCQSAGGCPAWTRDCPKGEVKVRTFFLTKDGEEKYSTIACPTDDPAVKVDPVAGLKTVPLPASVINVQPPDGETLVNLPTILSTSAATFTATVEPMKGQVITFTIAASSFVWHHGDGTKRTTTEPGKKWEENDDPQALINHVYNLKAEDLKVSVDTTWSATWTLNGVDQGAVSGTVTKVGEAQELDVLEARPTLVN